jgi:CDP-glycerol glycerophosphotransferase (TagB/SpsB family)
VFPFPFEPWPIQKVSQSNVSNSCQSCIKQSKRRKWGSLKAPQGQYAHLTQGKSLSIICGALKWQRDARKTTEQEELSTALDAIKCKVSANEPAWIMEQHVERQKNAIREQFRLKAEKRLEREKKLERIRNQIDMGEVKKQACGVNDRN